MQMGDCGFPSIPRNSDEVAPLNITCPLSSPRKSRRVSGLCENLPTITSKKFAAESSPTEMAGSRRARTPPSLCLSFTFPFEDILSLSLPSFTTTPSSFSSPFIYLSLSLCLSVTRSLPLSCCMSGRAIVNAKNENCAKCCE